MKDKPDNFHKSAEIKKRDKQKEKMICMGRQDLKME